MPMDLPDAQLVRNTLEGTDPGAYSRLVSRHYASVYRYACSLVQDWMEAQDLTQEAFLKGYFQLGSLHDPARFAPWVRRIVHSLAMDLQRQFRPQFYRHLDESVTADEATVAHSDASPLDELLRSELMRDLLQAARALPEPYRLPFALFHLDAMGYEEVADLLGLRLNTVKSLLHRARAKVRQQLAQHLDDAPQWATLALDFQSLPSHQGWSFRSGYEFLPGGVAEERAFCLRNGVLSLNSLGLYPDVLAGYTLYGIIDPTRPFVLSLRARKLREEARYPEYQVEPRPQQAAKIRNTGFGLSINTGRERFVLHLGMQQLRGGRGRILNQEVDNTRFHDYRLEGTPGVGYRLFVDGRFICSDESEPHTLANRIAFGDLTYSGGNAQAEVTALSFAQLQAPESGNTGSSLRSEERTEVLARQLVAAKPYQQLGNQEEPLPSFQGEQAAKAEDRLRRALRAHSRRWCPHKGQRLEARDFRE